MEGDEGIGVLVSRDADRLPTTHPVPAPSYPAPRPVAGE